MQISNTLGYFSLPGPDFESTTSRSKKFKSYLNGSPKIMDFAFRRVAFIGKDVY